MIIPDIMVNDKILLKLDDNVLFDEKIWTGILRQQLTKVEKDYLIIANQTLLRKRKLNSISFAPTQQYIDEFLEKILWGKLLV